MSQKDPTGVVERVEFDESPAANLSRLSGQARQAFERKEKKECLDLTRSILLIDPHHADALAMRAAIQSEMHRDLEDTRAFLRQAQAGESAAKPVLPDAPVAEVPEVLVLPAPPAMRLNLRWVALAFLFVIVVSSIVLLPKLRTSSNPSAATPVDSAAAAAPEKPVEESADVAIQPEAATTEAPKEPASTPAPPRPTPTLVAAATAVPPARAPSAPLAAAPAPAPRPSETAPELPAVVTGTGRLAISSSTSVDIYRNDVLLGSVPISLELPAGPQTLEYRHGNLRRIVTHTIAANETSKATITFDVTVQINSKPWAEVFIDGTARKDLGQTPLSGIRVPIGSVLSFENPQFPTKKYRVTGNESGIQIVFP